MLVFSVQVIMNQFWTDEIKLGKQREYQRGHCEAETPDQKAKRLEQNRKYASQHRENESTEGRTYRLAKMRAYEHQRRLVESRDDRAKRLARMRQYGRQRLQNESAEQRADRLAKMRARERQRRLVESESDRVERLSKMRDYQRQRRQGTQVKPSPKFEHEHSSVQMSLEDVKVSPCDHGAASSVQVSLEDQQNKLEGEIRHGPASSVQVSMGDQQSKLEGDNSLLNELQCEDECRLSTCEKEAELDDDRAKRLAKMRAYEHQRRQQESEEDRAKRLAKMRAREHQRRQEESEYDRAKRLTRMRVHHHQQIKQLEEMLKCEGQDVTDADGSPLEGDKSRQIAEHQGEQLERLRALQNQHKENDNSEPVHAPTSRFVGQEGNLNKSEGDGTKQAESMYEYQCSHDGLHTDSSIQAHTVSEKQQDQLENFKGFCYYSYYEP